MDPTTALQVREMPTLPVDVPAVFDGRTMWLRPGLDYVTAYAAVRSLLPEADSCAVQAFVEQVMPPRHFTDGSHTH